MTPRLIEDAGYTHGVVKEIPSWELPRGALADALNMIFDVPGIARQRGGTTALVSGAQTAFATMLGFCYSQNGGVTIEELYGVDAKSGNVYVINKVTGAATLVGGLGLSDAVVFRPVRHFGFVTFPYQGVLAGQPRGIETLAGQTSATTFANGAAASVTNGNQQVTLTGADVTTNVKVGAIVTIQNATQLYYGRVVSVDTTKLFTVWPTPTFTDTALTAGSVILNPDVSSIYGGKCGASFQNRLLIGNTVDRSSAGATLVEDRRIYYSLLPTESFIGGAVTYSGAVFVPMYIPEKNYIEVVGADPIVALEPVDDDELLILTSGGVHIFRGTLATQTTTSAPGVTFDIFPLNTNAGCLSDLSVQRTPHGIMWASTEGIMLYRGSGRIDDLTEGKYHVAWRNLTRGATFAIHGSTYVRNHYIVTGISGGTTFALAFNLDNGTWAPLGALDIFYGLGRPTDPSQVFALRWWNQSGTAPSMTNGQTLRYESIFAPDAAAQTKLDADGSVVPFSATLRSMTDDQQVERFLRRLSIRSQSQMAGANVTVNVGARLDSTDAVGVETVLVGSLSNTAVLTISGQSNATPIVITTSAAHGLQSGDMVDIHGCTPNTAANGRWMITVLSTTTFELNQSKGNGATSATGDAKRITEQEFLGTGVDIGQATWVKLDSSGTVNRFELHGARVSAMEIPRGMGAR